MNVILKLAGASALLVALISTSGCGTAVGAGIGGVAGHAIGNGSTAATVGGAVVGGVIGHEVTK